MLTCDKNIILTILQFERKISSFQFDIQNAYSCIETLSTSTINSTLLNPLCLHYLFFDMKDLCYKDFTHNKIYLQYQVRYLELLQSPKNPSLCTDRYSVYYFDYTMGK